MIARRRGFTLIEVLIALAILAVVAVLAYRATAALADGEVRLTANPSAGARSMRCSRVSKPMRGKRCRDASVPVRRSRQPGRAPSTSWATQY